MQKFRRKSDSYSTAHPFRITCAIMREEAASMNLETQKILAKRTIRTWADERLEKGKSAFTGEVRFSSYLIYEPIKGNGQKAMYEHAVVFEGDVSPYVNTGGVSSEEKALDELAFLLMTTFKQSRVKVALLGEHWILESNPEYVHE